MIKPIYYFACKENLQEINDRSTDGEMYLSALIGNTLSTMMRNRDCPLELIRINRGEGMQIIARRRFNDIKCEIYERK